MPGFSCAWGCNQILSTRVPLADSSSRRTRWKKCTFTPRWRSTSYRGEKTTSPIPAFIFDITVPLELKTIRSIDLTAAPAARFGLVQSPPSKPKTRS